MAGLHLGLLAIGLPGAAATPASAGTATVVITNLASLHDIASRHPPDAYAVRLEGRTLWASALEGRLALQDDSGIEEIELDAPAESMLAGRRVRIEGAGTIALAAARVKIGARGPVVDNDGLHGMIVKSGRVYLEAGRQPLRLDWFNRLDQYGLEVECEGPGLPRQRLADALLFTSDTNAPGDADVRGLLYRCYEGAWEAMPDFQKLAPTRAGHCANFNPELLSRAEHAGVQFTGFFNAPQAGVYAFHLKSDDGSRLFVGRRTATVRVLGRAELPEPRSIPLGMPLPDGPGAGWGMVEGTVAFASWLGRGGVIELVSGEGRMRVEVAEDPDARLEELLNKRIRATGVYRRAVGLDGRVTAGLLLVSRTADLRVLELPPARVHPAATADPARLPELTAAVEVHRLNREEAQRGYPVRIRGVVTCVLPEHQAFTVQDTARGIYVVDTSPERSTLPRMGEYYEIEGTTDPSLFAPIVNARRVTGLGSGALPEPVHPTWDQLLNGSLDAQYAEIQGILTAINGDRVTLLTREGRLNLELRVIGAVPEMLSRFGDALVRIRGTLFATWDYVTHQVRVGELRLYDASIAVDQPAPADLFATPEKTVAALLLFDPQAGVWQRVKVSGQITHVLESEYYLANGGRGLRFLSRRPMQFAVGDQVEVVGYPELGRASPLLREAVARRTGHAPLPEPARLAADDLVRPDRDATRVRVEGLLVGVRETRTEQVLEMQSGVRTFAARLATRDGAIGSLPVGSRLELSGVYSGQGISSFELLLHSPGDVRVVARPPWWTLQRLLVIVGALAAVLAITVLWITQLHRQVEERTAQLEAQIRERQMIEHQRAMEQERARVAQDLHDELGSGITEISMLATRAKSASNPDDRRSGYLDQVSVRAHDMVTALDEIVWAMNPRHDTLASLVSYFSLYADRFLGLANIAWRLDPLVAETDRPVDSRQRHQLFLAFKEALTNVVRHSGATEVRLRIQAADGELRLSVSDNGCGLPPGAPVEGMDGVANMRRRVENLRGRFELESVPGRGTTVRIAVPSR